MPSQDNTINERQLKLLQRLGEDCAYTFKGLYKESGLLQFKYNLYLSVPILFSIITLGFDQEISGLYLKLFAVLSLIFTVFALLGQKRFERIEGYRAIADEVKSIYDLAEESYMLQNFSQYQNLRDKWNTTRLKLKGFPITFWSRTYSVWKIQKEMNLSWLGGEYS